MKELFVSNCERAFAIKAAAEGTRLDGRESDESRRLKICFGSAWGSCHVALGNTKVAAHASCKVEQPKQARPNEGLINVNVELGPMGAPNFERGQSDLNVYLNRLIEKCIIDSRCVDLESLCIIAEEKVWAIRIDVHVLNHAGNIIECASVAALSALAHFKRPDVTTDGTQITVHTFAEKDPIPMVLHHYPVCVSFGFFNSETMVSDPSLLEENVCSSVGAIFVIGMNSFREICLFDLASAAITLGPENIYKAANRAAKRIQYIIGEIKSTLAEDDKMRSEDSNVGFSNAISTDKLLMLPSDNLCLQLKKFDLNASIEGLVQKSDKNPETSSMVMIGEKGVAALLPEESVNKSAENVWTAMVSDDEKSEDEEDSEPQDEKSDTDRDNSMPQDEKSDEEVQIVKEIKPYEARESIEIGSSEEEEVVVLETKKPKPSKKKKKLYSF